jgi:hypothetical protein
MVTTRASNSGNEKRVTRNMVGLKPIGMTQRSMLTLHHQSLSDVKKNGPLWGRQQRASF